MWSSIPGAGTAANVPEPPKPLLGFEHRDAVHLRVEADRFAATAESTLHALRGAPPQVLGLVLVSQGFADGTSHAAS